MCDLISFDRQCVVGEYAGNHTRVKDSECLQCQYLDVSYQGVRLHTASSSGDYNDPYSCDIKCLAFSRLRNVSEPILGCQTCELGNVLYKQFTQAGDDKQCQFECLPGYVKVNRGSPLDGGDCEIGSLVGDAHSLENQTVNVTHVQRVLSSSNVEDGAAAFKFTVSHTSHGHFVVVVGNQEPECTGRERQHKQNQCCFEGLYRVSTKLQMGLSAQVNESCSQQPALITSRVGSTQLTFEIPDTRLAEIGNCHWEGSQLNCELHVSIVNVVMFGVYSVTVRVQLQRAASMSVIGGAHTYIPLSQIRVEAQLAYNDRYNYVIAVVSDILGTTAAGNIEVELRGTNMVLTNPVQDCLRYLPNSVFVDNTKAKWLVNTSIHTITTTYMNISSTVHTDNTLLVQLYYTLRLLDRERADDAVHNQMHITVWRKIKLSHAVCQPTPETSHVVPGDVLSCSGLGAEKVAHVTAHKTSLHEVRGELGGLSSFVARAAHSHISMIKLRNVLVTNVLPPFPVIYLQNYTFLQGGNLHFTPEFKQVCLESNACVFNYAHYDVYGRQMHIMHSCSVSAQQIARNWLVSNLGVVHDAGHVAALCALVHRDSTLQTNNQFMIALLNTKAYLPQNGQWYNYHNRSASKGSTYVQANFKFE